MTAVAEAPVTVLSTTAKKQPTRSGDVQLIVVTDADAPLAMAGDVLLRETLTGYEPVTVHLARTGVAFDDSLPPQPYDVPVLECLTLRGRKLVYAPSDLLRVVAHNRPSRVIVEAPPVRYRTDCLIWVDDFGSNGPQGMRWRCYFDGRDDEPLGIGPWSVGSKHG